MAAKCKHMNKISTGYLQSVVNELLCYSELDMKSRSVVDFTQGQKWMRVHDCHSFKVHFNIKYCPYVNLGDSLDRF